MKQTGKSVNKFCKENGVQKKWVAEKIGLDHRYFYQILKGKFGLPQNYWINLIKATRGEVTLSDLMQDILDADFITEKCGDSFSCLVTPKAKDEEKTIAA